MATRIYLDTCVYNRPFDDQTQPRIWLETLAFSVILQMIENGAVELVSSSVVAYENSRHPHQLQQRWVEKVSQLATYTQLVHDEIRKRAAELEQAGIKALDALHVACAEAAGVDCFVTCDDGLLRRYRNLTQAQIDISDPSEFVRTLAEE